MTFILPDSSLTSVNKEEEHYHHHHQQQQQQQQLLLHTITTIAAYIKNSIPQSRAEANWRTCLNVFKSRYAVSTGSLGVHKQQLEKRVGVDLCPDWASFEICLPSIFPTHLSANNAHGFESARGRWPAE
ncbi:conserved hypothetical protein [Trichinella spiralis]|uniref:hypothetical protein n=1 Tax=Trichinella spiralis TaxID=6334 RepID=UPI0001EFB610|nr:conserved hypothetical protein [Trichinella spiralis]